MEEKVILVDDNDKEVGTMEKMAAHQGEGKRHRAISVLVFNDKNELMLQQRAFSKYHCGGKWSNTCCTHPRLRESVAEAAKRRLREEMGVECDLKKVYEFNYQVKLDHGLSENEHDHVFVGRFNGEPLINPEEVNDWQWITIDQLNKELVETPEKYTYWFTEIAKELNKRFGKVWTR